MSMHISTFAAQLVTVDTTLLFSEVTARLEIEINKQGSVSIMSQMKDATSKEEIEGIVNNLTGPSNFLYFGEMAHDKWLSKYDGRKHPAIVNYMFGNPLIAQSILRHDAKSALGIPPRITVLEKDHGTQVAYYLPSSLVGWSEDENLLTAFRNLDNVIEQLIARVTST